MSGNCSEDDTIKDNLENGNWEKQFDEFVKLMRNTIIRQIYRKGYPTKERLRTTPNSYLKNKLNEHLELNHYIDVANYSFMLHQKQK